MEERFNEIKKEILSRARAAEACREQYGRAYKAQDMTSLCDVIKDNFWWCCHHGVLTGNLVEKYREEFAARDIYVNVDVRKGFLLAWDSATVEASGSATVRAWDSATVEASGSATVRASDSATVRASDSATVEAWDSVTVEASDSAYCSSYCTIECKLSENALYRVRKTNTVYFASDDINFERQS